VIGVLLMVMKAFVTKTYLHKSPYMYIQKYML